MTAELAVSLGNAGDLAELLGIGIQVLEQILTGIIEVDFVCRDQSAEGQRIVFDELDAFPVARRGGVGRKIKALDDGVLQIQSLCPLGENTHDRGLPGRNTDEIDGRLCCLLVSIHSQTPLSYWKLWHFAYFVSLTTIIRTS